MGDMEWTASWFVSPPARLEDLAGHSVYPNVATLGSTLITDK
jgi:hypothetical protein